MKHPYPVLLDLEDKPCLVIGEGPLAEDKARGLREAGAHVTRHACYTPGSLAGFFLVLAAGEERAGNAEIYREAEAAGVLVNALDDPEHCRFILPAIHRQGDLVVAVSTSGACPALAVRVRDRVAREYGPHYAAFLALMRRLRGPMRGWFPDFGARRAAWYGLVDSGALEALAAGDEAGAAAKINATIERAKEEQPCPTW